MANNRQAETVASDVRLEVLFKQLPLVAAEAMEATRLHRDFFDDVVQALRDAPIVHSKGREVFFAMWEARDPDCRSSGDPRTPEEAQVYGIYWASVVVIRSLLRSGFLAFCRFHQEAVAVHRRTIEALIQLELLIDHQELAESYWGHALEVDRRERKTNPFAKAVENIQSRVKDPRLNPAILSPLQRLLHQRGQNGQINSGAHAGLQHAISGHTKAGIGFFDANSSASGRYAFRCAWETMQLCNALRPKLAWIGEAKWEAKYVDLRTQARVIESMSAEQDGYTGPPAPWSSFQP